MTTILVTGGTGYIGSHTIVELLNQNFDVIVIDNLSNSNPKSIEGIKKITNKNITFYKVDLQNFNDIVNVFSNHKNIIGVIHFAALKAVGESYENPLLYFQNNIFGMINLLKAISLQKQNINFIFSSSCTVYGSPDYLPVDEKHPIKEALNPYGRTKQIGEGIIKDTLLDHKNISAISLRYFNPIGAHDSGLIGEAPIKPYNLIPVLCEPATGKRNEMLVFGNDYPTTDGTGVRDYIHVVDLAKAHVAALKKLLNKKDKQYYDIFNLGVGKGFSVLEMIKTFEKVSKKKINYRIVERRKGDIAEIYADPTKANKILNWKAERSLEDMLKSAWLWESKFRYY